MFYKLVPYFSLIIISAYGNVVRENQAYSMQRFSRPDIPISYQFTNIHDYKRESNHNKKEHTESESVVKTYPQIQYAPLNLNTKAVNGKIRPNEVIPDDSTIHTGLHVYTGQEKPQVDHLEPKPLKEDDNVNQQNYKSFISGHNVQTYSHATDNYLEPTVNPYASLQEFHQNQKVQGKPPKFVYYQKLKEKSADAPKLSFHIVNEGPPNEAFKFLKFLPADYNAPARKENIKSLPYSYSLHNNLLLEKQLQTYAHPRIHLNIARHYNIANQAPEAHFPQILLPKMPALNNLLPLRPHRTLMVPI